MIMCYVIFFDCCKVGEHLYHETTDTHESQGIKEHCWEGGPCSGTVSPCPPYLMKAIAFFKTIVHTFIALISTNSNRMYRPKDGSSQERPYRRRDVYLLEMCAMF